MKAFYRQYLFAPVCVALGLTMVFAFQNCSRDASFKSNGSGELGNLNNGQGTDVVVGGSSAVVIRMIESPRDMAENISQTVSYEITTPGSRLRSVNCQLNGADVQCSGADSISIAPTGLGAQNFTILAENEEGITGTQSIDWTIYNRIVAKSKDFDVTGTGDKVDIIINVDNSGTMEYEHQRMASRVANLMAPFAGLDYHIAITTTSPIGSSTIWKSSLNYVDGKFVPLDNSGTYCIKKGAQSLAQAQQLISDNVVRGLHLLDDSGNILTVGSETYPEGNGWERGIFTTYRAFERNVAGQQQDNSCIRDGSVPKHVIVISDEDETLFEEDVDNNVIGPALIYGNKSNGGALRQLIADEYGANTIFKFHSIIVNPNSPEGASCLATQGRVVGARYAQLSQETGGYVGSVCADDYSTQLGEIGQVISNSISSKSLECIAVPDSQGDYGTVVDRNSGQELSIAYGFNGDKVDFASALGMGNYNVTYNCFE